jgi:hypothetical protein
MGSLNSGGIRETQWLPWVSTTPLVRELLAKKILVRIDRRRSAQEPPLTPRGPGLPDNGHSDVCRPSYGVAGNGCGEIRRPFLYATPSFTTTTTFVSDTMSKSGSPLTTVMSASLPG